MKNPDNRFRSDLFDAGLRLGPKILAKSQPRRKKLDGVNPCAMLFESEESGVRKIEKN